MARPIVGMPSCLDERERWRAGRRYAYIDCAYADALTSAGAAPLHLPIQPDADGIVARLDALLLPGGDDLLPADAEAQRYPAGCFDAVPAPQLAFDQALLAAALARNLPVLGICYGMQLMALAAGGGLFFDLPVDRPEGANHRLPESPGLHSVSVEAGSRLARLTGTSRGEVNSLHHQGVREAGAGWRAVAHADDGLIEAIEGSEGSFRIGVQWHPEKLAGPLGAGLFSGLVEAARDVRTPRP